MFGTVDRPVSGGYVVSSLLHCCISREFQVLEAGGSSPITDWLRKLCRQVHEELGGPGVGALGMCMMGNFALALRFTADPVCTRARFKTLRRELGEGFESIEIDSGPGNPWGIKGIAHSVLTEELLDDDGHPTKQASIACSGSSRSDFDALPDCGLVPSAEIGPTSDGSCLWIATVLSTDSSLVIEDNGRVKGTDHETADV